MERSDSGGFLSGAFGNDEEHADDEFLLIDDDEDVNVEFHSDSDSVPLFKKSSIPASTTAAAPTVQSSCWRANHDESIQMEPVKFNDNEPTVKKKSSMKKSSSYGCLTDEIPICMKNSSYKTLPKPDMSSSTSMSSFFQNKDDTPRIKRNVSFSNIRMRNYPLILGDNPSVSYGPPTTLDWHFEETNEINLEAYEEHRAPRRRPREMLLNYYQRKAILEQSGHSEEEMKKAKRQAERVKRQRSATKSMVQFMVVENAVQSAARKAKRAVKKSNSTGTLYAYV